MKSKVYKKIRIVGCSEKSYEHAIEQAVKKASGTIHGMSWFEVVELRGAIANGNPCEWQATLEVALKVD